MTSHKSKSKEAYLFNPFEIAFCGYSETGKTTLITSLLKELSPQHKIGYVKHDAHKFQIDYEGKDTYKAYNSGAETVFINDKEHYAMTGKGLLDKTLEKTLFLDYDFVFVEGYKDSNLPKIVFIDATFDILKFELTNIIAFVGTTDSKPTEIVANTPYFNRNDILSIKNFIMNFFSQLSHKIPLFGLVLTGGKSTRMKQDKAKLEYHGKPQFQHTYDLLSTCCEKVFISSRAEQKEDFPLPQIHDTFLDLGPMGGILSALKAYPKTAFLVLACDLPYITQETLKKLLTNRNTFKIATSYQSPSDSFPEPLCAIYEPKSKTRLLQFLALDYSCPRKVLINSDTKLIHPDHVHEMNNINHPEEYSETISFFKEKL